MPFLDLSRRMGTPPSPSHPPWPLTSSPPHPYLLPGPSPSTGEADTHHSVPPRSSSRIQENSPGTQYTVSFHLNVHLPSMVEVLELSAAPQGGMSPMMLVKLSAAPQGGMSPMMLVKLLLPSSLLAGPSGPF